MLHKTGRRFRAASFTKSASLSGTPMQEQEKEMMLLS
jgi:hypothetical protein